MMNKLSFKIHTIPNVQLLSLTYFSGRHVLFSSHLLVRLQPAEDISVVSWNRQVQHILASANPSGKAVVWDLRKNEPIIKISDHSNRVCGEMQMSLAASTNTDLMLVFGRNPT